MKNTTHVNEFQYKVRYWNPIIGFEKIREEIHEAIDRIGRTGNWIIGEEVEQFEKTLAERVGTKYAIGLNSGTDALYLAMRAAGIGQGDEVITVSHTFIATISEIARTGATPVLVDVGDNFLMDPAKVREAITPKTKAIIPVHLSGDVCDMDALRMIAAQHNLIIIEDAAQAFSGEWEGKKAGSMGFAGCFSFYPAKLLGAYGDAGALTTNDEDVYKTVKNLRDHNLIGKRRDSIEYGVNSRLDSIQAAILNIKLKYIDEMIGYRAYVAKLYSDGLRDVHGVSVPIEREGRVWQDYVILAENRDQLAKFLDEQSIKVRGHDLIPNHDYDLGFRVMDMTNTERYHYKYLRLPFSAEITEEEVDYVIAKIKEFYA